MNEALTSIIVLKRPNFQTENLRNMMSVMFIMLTCPCNLDHYRTTLFYSKTVRGLSKRITSFCGYKLELLELDDSY